MTFSISRAMTFRRVKIGIIEDSAEDTFRHEMLREHALNFCLGEVRINCVSALLMEVRKRLAEGGGMLTFRCG